MARARPFAPEPFADFQRKHVLGPEVAPEAGTGERIEVLVGGQRQHPAQSRGVQIEFGVLREWRAVVALEAGHAGPRDVVPLRVGERHLDLLLFECGGDGARERVRADDQETAGVRFGDLQHSRQGAGREALQHHRADDDHEGDRHQQVGTRVALRFELDREKCADRRGHDTARRDPRKQRARAR